MSENYYINNLYSFQDLVLKLIMKVDDAFYLLISFTELIRGKIY